MSVRREGVVRLEVSHSVPRCGAGVRAMWKACVLLAQRAPRPTWLGIAVCAVLAPAIARGAAAQAVDADSMLQAPDPRLSLNASHVGPGCCYEFAMFQLFGVSTSIDKIVWTITTPGVTIASVTSPDISPLNFTVGGTTLDFRPTGIDTALRHFTICFTIAPGAGPVTFNYKFFDSNGAGCTPPNLFCEGGVTLTDPSCQNAIPCAMLLPNTFTSERFSALPNDRMQVVAMYDGNGLATLEIELWDPVTGDCCWLKAPPISNSKLVAVEYDMQGFEPTGKFRLSGIVPNGIIDGIAFGLYARNVVGDRWVLRSSAPGIGSGRPNFVGGWPLAWPESMWDAKMPAWLVGTSYDRFVARRQAQMTLSGAQMLPSNGLWGTTTPLILGDADGDGCVDGDDLNLVIQQQGAGCCP